MIRRKLKTLKLLKKIPQSSQNEIQKPHAPHRKKKKPIIIDFLNIKFSVINFDYWIFFTNFVIEFVVTKNVSPIFKMYMFRTKKLSN
jgi:hypothetical protein